MALKTDGTKGLFRGTVPLLSREVPFYVLGMTGYAYLKNVFNGRIIPLAPLSLYPRVAWLRMQARRAKALSGYAYLEHVFNGGLIVLAPLSLCPRLAWLRTQTHRAKALPACLPHRPAGGV